MKKNLVSILIVSTYFLLLSTRATPIIMAECTNDCPKIRIYCNSSECCGEKRKFSFMFQSADSDKQPTIVWSVSKGKIIKGQGDGEIEVDATGVEEPMTVTVELGGVMPKGCPASASETVCDAKENDARGQIQQPNVYSIPGLSFEIEKRRLDEVASELKLSPDKRVYLIAYNKAGRKKSIATNRLRQSRKYLITKHGISTKRITTVYGGTKIPGIVMEIFIVDSDSQSPLIKEKKP